jgi:hypothetical protein
MPNHPSRKRSSRRSNVLLVAALELPDRSQPVKLRNLSEEGALVEGAGMVDEDCEIVFRRNKLRVRGRVVWVQGPYAGIKFARQLKASEVLRNIPKPRSPAKLDFRRPGLACRPLTDKERKMLETWMRVPQVESLGE